ncbi:unnamed protein product, partial [Pylaiella littoralis]
MTFRGSASSVVSHIYLPPVVCRGILCVLCVEDLVYMEQYHLLGELQGGARYLGGQEFDWLRRMQEDLEAFDIVADKKEGWEASAKRADEWYDRIDEGARRFTDEWLKKEGDLSETRRRKRERDAA